MKIRSTAQETEEPSPRKALGQDLYYELWEGLLHVTMPHPWHGVCD
jgi:hypothetical protein